MTSKKLQSSKSKEISKEDFAHLIVSYRPKLESMIYRITRNRQTSQDLTQETFLRAYKYQGQFNHNSTIYTWLYKIARNTALNHVRNKSRQHMSLEHDVYSDRLESNCDHTVRSRSPETNALLHEAKDNIKKDMHQLPIVLKEPLILRTIGEMTYEQISIVMKCPIGTVRSRICRARRILKNKPSNKNR